MKYDINKEYVNIENYSPFSHINEVSPQFRNKPFELPFIYIDNEFRPVHPDTFNDLGLKNEIIEFTIKVYPTASFRTLYFPEKNICYKVPILRRITRGIRKLSHKDLKRSEKASDLLSKHRFSGFDYLREICHFSKDENFNYIERKMPDDKEYFPWFYVMASRKFEKKFEKKVAEKIIESWMHYASKDILLEYHTQNILVNYEGEIMYRDLSDVRSFRESILNPSYIKKISGFGDLLSIMFDRTVCKQNLDHLFRYSKNLTMKDKNDLKNLIKEKIKEYDLPFPKNYSLDFPLDTPERVPQKTTIVWWRQF